MSIEIVTCPSPDVRMFLARVRLNEVEFELSGTGLEGGVCQALAEIAGVEHVLVEGRVVTIFKLPGARWEEIESGVVELLECFG
jgi:hypothetical protein